MLTIPKQTRPLGKLHMITSRPMTCFATDIDFGKCCVVTFCSNVEVFVIASAMTSRTSRIPILRDTGPMQRIGGVDFFKHIWRRKIKPFLLTGIPRNSQHLHFTDFIFSRIGRPLNLDHVLL